MTRTIRLDLVAELWKQSPEYRAAYFAWVDVKGRHDALVAYIEARREMGQLAEWCEGMRAQVPLILEQHSKLLEIHEVAIKVVEDWRRAGQQLNG